MEDFLSLNWLFERVSRSSLLALSLLALVFIGVVVGFTQSVRGLDIGLLLSVAALAIMSSWFLATKIKNLWRVASLGLGLGLGATLLIVGQLGPQLLTTLAELSLYSLRLWPPPFQAPPIEPAAAALVEFLTQTNTLFIRLRDWVTAIIANEPTYDPVAASLAWVFIVWLLTAWATVNVERHKPLPGLLPVVGLLTFIVAYVGTNTAHLLLPLTGTLLLTASSMQRARESRWLSQNTDFAESIRIDLLTVTLITTTALIVTAAFVPSLSLRTFTDWIHDLTTQTSGSAAPDSLGVQAGANGSSAFDPLRYGGLPQQRLIGSGPELSKIIIMIITPDDPNLNYYWRSVVYNQYTGRGWTTSDFELVDYRANIRLHASPLPGQQLARFRVQEVEPLGKILFHPGTLITSEADFSVAWRPGSDFFRASVLGSYRAESYVAQPTASQLQTSLNRYPNEILSRYLTLPDTIPARVISLARDLTATARTPYDRAVAIETYLRQFPYTLDLPAPPLNVEIADYFLFTLKRGYCDYYATSMVVLARAAGLPARFVTGYARGTLDPQTNSYIVTAADAHSWVEVYFDEYGWVEFEPTGGRPAIDRELVPEATLSAEPPFLEEPSETASFPTLPFGWPTLVGLLSVLVVSLPAWHWLDQSRLARLSPYQTILTLFRRLSTRADRLGVVRIQGDTPYEFAQAVRERLAQRRVAAPTREAVDHLVQMYVQACYSPHPLTRSEQQRAIQLWGKLKWQLWRLKPI